METAVLDEGSQTTEAGRNAAPVNPFAEFAELLNRDPLTGHGRTISTTVPIPADATVVASVGAATGSWPRADAAAPQQRSPFMRLLSRILDVQTDANGDDEVCINVTIGGKRSDRRTG